MAMNWLEGAPIEAHFEISLEALIDGWQPSTAVVPDGPGGPSLLTEDLLGTTDGVGNVIAQ